MFELAEHEIEVASRYLQPLSVILFDVDHFKHINDTFGHVVGDQLLKMVTKIACAEMRTADIIGRYGGEEFVILLPMTNAEQAFLLAERIRTEMAAACSTTEKGDVIVTISTGVAEFNPNSGFESIEDLIQYADKAMYVAKQAGRNRTVISDRR